MKVKQFLSPKEASLELGVCVKTLQRWDKAGKIRTVRTPSNQRRIPLEEVRRLQGKAPAPDQASRCVLYARVSTARQEQDGNLARQVARLQEAALQRGYTIVETITEHASSINEKRKGIRHLLSLVERQAMEVILVEYPDRLVRFGFKHMEQACAWKGVRIEVVETPKLQEPSEELVQDLLSIVTVFAGRMYGYRSKGVRSRVAGALQEHMLPDGTSVEGHQAAPRSGGEL